MPIPSGSPSKTKPPSESPLEISAFADAPAGRPDGIPRAGTIWVDQRLLNRLERGGKGLLPALARDLAGADDLLSRASLDLVRERLLPAAAEARRAAEQLFLRLHALLLEIFTPEGIGTMITMEEVA